MLGYEANCAVHGCDAMGDQTYVIQSMTGRRGGMPFQLEAWLCAKHSREVERNAGWNNKWVNGKLVTYSHYRRGEGK